MAPLTVSFPRQALTRPVLLTDPALFINREVSWLAFNERVLAQAIDPAHPLLERLKFLAIVATNLEEFFMVRVAALLRTAREGLDDSGVDGLTTTATLARVRTQVADMLQRQAGCWKRLRPDLVDHGIRVLEPRAYTAGVSGFLQRHFVRDVLPVLQPVPFGRGRGLSVVSHVSQNLAVVLRQAGKTRLIVLAIPPALPRFVSIPAALAPAGARTFALLEDVIRANIHTLFPGARITGTHLFRLVRDADVVIQEDEAHDLLESVGHRLEHRRPGAVAMLQVERTTPPTVLGRLMRTFALDEDRTYRVVGRIGYGDWMQLANQPRPDLQYAPLTPVSVWRPDTGGNLFDELEQRDRLVHHPFESFGMVEAFIGAAVADPHVVAIRIALYRIGTNSPLVDLLVEAAEAGKQVTVFVELKARFDEENNVKWATRLEAAGAMVAYGISNLKIHAKICLVVRTTAAGTRGYVHIGTGNYNAQTARTYTDLGMFTSRPSIVQDAEHLFDVLVGHSNQTTYRDLLVAPSGLRTGLMALVQHEADEARAGRAARIIIKVNAITDPEVIRALYRASQAGVRIDLIVRGVCSLRPGVVGVSESISVRSVVGRFLEHSRIFWFQNGDAPRVFIGSADIMERSLDRRVEVLCPVHDRDLAGHLRDVVLETLIHHTKRTWLLGANRRYGPAATDDGLPPPADAQESLADQHATEEQPRR